MCATDKLVIIMVWIIFMLQVFIELKLVALNLKACWCVWFPDRLIDLSFAMFSHLQDQSARLHYSFFFSRDWSPLCSAFDVGEKRSFVRVCVCLLNWYQVNPWDILLSFIQKYYASGAQVKLKVDRKFGIYTVLQPLSVSPKMNDKKLAFFHRFLRYSRCANDRSWLCLFNVYSFLDSYFFFPPLNYTSAAKVTHLKFKLLVRSLLSHRIIVRFYRP